MLTPDSAQHSLNNEKDVDKLTTAQEKPYTSQVSNNSAGVCGSVCCTSTMNKTTRTASKPKTLPQHSFTSKTKNNPY